MGQSIPGLSKSSISLLALTQLRFFVMPGLLPTVALFLPTILFIRVDLPTFGIPNYDRVIDLIINDIKSGKIKDITFDRISYE